MNDLIEITIQNIIHLSQNQNNITIARVKNQKTNDIWYVNYDFKNTLASDMIEGGKDYLSSNREEAIEIVFKNTYQPFIDGNQNEPFLSDLIKLVQGMNLNKFLVSHIKYKRINSHLYACGPFFIKFKEINDEIEFCQSPDGTTWTPELGYML